MKRPHQGQRLRARRTLEVHGVVSYRAPFTDGFSGTFPAGAVAIVAEEPSAFALAVQLVPEEYQLFEQIFVSDRQRGETYAGYAIVVSLWTLWRCFSAIEDRT